MTIKSTEDSFEQISVHLVLQCGISSYCLLTTRNNRAMSINIF